MESKARGFLVFPSSNPQQIEWNLAKKKWTLCWGTSLFFFKAPIRSRSPLLTGSRLISLPLAIQMFQFAKFEKSKECRLATELGYGFPIGDPWITDGISPWPFASESVLPSQCPGIHPMHSFRSCTLCRLASHRLHKLRRGTLNTNQISTNKSKLQATTSWKKARRTSPHNWHTVESTLPYATIFLSSLMKFHPAFLIFLQFWVSR